MGSGRPVIFKTDGTKTNLEGKCGCFMATNQAASEEAVGASRLHCKVC